MNCGAYKAYGGGDPSPDDMPYALTTWGPRLPRSTLTVSRAQAQVYVAALVQQTEDAPHPDAARRAGDILLDLTPEETITGALHLTGVSFSLAVLPDTEVEASIRAGLAQLAEGRPGRDLGSFAAYAAYAADQAEA